MAATDAGSDTWSWCLRHRQVERDSDSTCPADERLGPYESQEAAERWQERTDARNQTWDKEDKEWSGDD